MIQMRHILERKSFKFISVPSETKVSEVLRVLAKEQIGLVVVVDGDTLRGVFSERDAVRLAVSHGQIPLELPVAMVMTTQVFTVTQDLTVDECMSLMIQRSIRHVPVLDGAKLVGVVSMRDVVLEAVAQRETTIRGLETYIIGGDYPPIANRAAEG